jgi:hypothetical protein
MMEDEKDMYYMIGWVKIYFPKAIGRNINQEFLYYCT